MNNYMSGLLVLIVSIITATASFFSIVEFINKALYACSGKRCINDKLYGICINFQKEILPLYLKLQDIEIELEGDSINSETIFINETTNLFNEMNSFAKKILEENMKYENIAYDIHGLSYCMMVKSLKMLYIKNRNKYPYLRDLFAIWNIKTKYK